MNLEVFPIRSNKIVNFGDDVYQILQDSMQGIEFKEGDILTITSKVVTMEQKDAIIVDDVVPTDEAIEIANEAKMNPKVVQIVIDESKGEIIGQVFHAILAKTPYGLSANAGIDLSNAPDGYALLLPRNPDEYADKIRKAIKKDYNVNIAVIVSDSRTVPLRRGTTAVAIGIAGMEPVIDERGNKDLYGYTMTISTRAVADGAANCANLVMGETNEQTPFALIRGLAYNTAEKQSMLSALMPEDQCLYFAPLLKLMK